ncbi:MAG: cytochrome c oxidase assembly protein [Enhydrobacter sp.]|nr:MAG: cytochrome c oxidase assembly protein [Enhydrobacter sp.]
MVGLSALHAAAFVRSPSRGRQAACAALGWALLFVLFVSPLCALASALFSARIAHHALMIAVVAPLLVLGWPCRPIFKGASPGAIAALAVLHAAVLWSWHAPSAYGAALSNTTVYWVMELTLLGTALLLWQVLLSPWAHLSVVMVALVGTATQMALLGALITFAPAPLYEPHLLTTEPWGLTALQDQQLAGLIMWIPASLPYVVVGLALVFRRFLAPAWAPRSS